MAAPLTCEDGLVVPEPGEDPTVLLGPKLLKKGASVEATLVFEGQPGDLVVVDEVENVRFRRQLTVRQANRRFTGLVFLAMAALTGILVVWFLSDGTRRRGRAPLPLQC